MTRADLRLVLKSSAITLLALIAIATWAVVTTR